ncbi:MAG TPA: response regulator [Bacteroidales bacterium]
MAGKLKILFVEDVLIDAELIWREIEKNNISFSKVLVDKKDKFLEYLKDFEPDLIISDYRLPQFDGMTALSLRNEQAPLIPFILVTGSVNEEVAVECMKAGADDYILKDNLSRLVPAILNSIKKSKLAKEKIAAKEDLQKSEMRLQKAQAIAHVGNWELDLSRKTMWGSDEALSIYGLNQKTHEIPYEIAKNIPLHEYRLSLDEALDRLLKYNEPYDIEFKIKRENDGELRWIHSKAELIFESDGEQVKVAGVLQDITDHKSSEEAVKHERRTLRTLIDNLPNQIYVKDKECRKVIANKADVENIGKTKESEVLGKTDIELFPGHIGERGYSDDKKILKTGKPIFDLEEEFISAVGIKRWILTTKIPLRDKDGNVNGLVGIGHDITERKHIIEELIRAKEKAEESDKLKTAFLHNISHEIRTPMNAIVGFSALLGEPDLDRGTQKSYIEIIMHSSDHLLSIISDIVDISNIEANLTKTLENEISLNKTIKSLCNQFIPKAKEKKIELVCENGLSDSDDFILTDSTKLNQILSNLMSNALKFTEKGFIKLHYKVNDNFLEFCVSDTGIGILPEYYDRIFDRFYQVQSEVTRLYEGTGLGLSISKAYVELLGGRIWVTSEPGKGTSFFFTIPYIKQIIKTMHVYEDKVPDTFVFEQKKIILVAEDVESNYKLIRYFLSGSNTEILHAFNGKEAVEKFLSISNIDLILMDIKMPVMDGYTAVKLIREKNNTIPIIAQTAYADDKERAIECGCTGFISKPFDKKGLFRVLSEFI